MTVQASPLRRAVPVTDEEIVPRILAGETSLFEVLMRRHNERVYRAARAILRDEGEAEDVMQQAYVNAYVHLAQFDGRATFATWLTKIAVHEALARARRRGRFEPLDDRLLETTMTTASPPDPERQAFGRELGALIEAAVDRLGDGYREVFMLREVQGLSTLETADILSVSEDVVKTRLSRARIALQRDLLDRTGAAAASAFTFGQGRCDRIVSSVLARIADLDGARPSAR